ncbi:MAG: CDP-2,3-bis-(O-geranylgeranyl)-sn-glycerol synthase [Desulfurococcales archaeon]|nr:CDP-2,3-bis-(O-geranylgeranyl)-sn-glycerol synthase [Desulfurococcales archaeon]
MGILSDLLWHLQLILPAMAANGAPVVVLRYVKNSHPVDFNLKFLDGRRLLGDGKTWEGVTSGLVAGLVVSAIIAIFSQNAGFITLGILSSIGALIGDMAGSFVKRRINMPRGAPAPLLDQLDFYVGALLLLYIAGVQIRLVPSIILAVVVLVLHVGTNYMAYRLGLKNVPW